MPSCSVIVCKNTSSKVNYVKDGISFHTYPKEPKLKEKWINATGRGPNWFPTKNSTICSSHFEPKCFQPLKKVHRLFEWSEPTLKIRMVLTNYTEPSKACEDLTVVSEPAPLSRIDRVDTNIDVRQNCTMEPQVETPRKRKLRRLICVQENLIKKQKTQIKRLQKRTSRYTKKISDLKEILGNLKEKNYIGADHITQLENIGVTDLMQRYEKNLSSGQTTNQKYTPALRIFASTLHFYSPKAYAYVRKKFQTALPHVRTIKKWYQSIDAQPGFTQESLKAIKLRAACSPHKLLCNLVIDEMAIKQRVEWDGKQMHGYVDISNSAAQGDCLPEAKEALVFLVTAVNGSWKIPVGYFLVDGVTGEQRSNLVTQCLELLE